MLCMLHLQITWKESAPIVESSTLKGKNMGSQLWILRIPKIRQRSENVKISLLLCNLRLIKQEHFSLGDPDDLIFFKYKAQTFRSMVTFRPVSIKMKDKKFQTQKYGISVDLRPKKIGSSSLYVRSTIRSPENNTHEKHQ